MPTLEISPEQEAYIEALREELADQVTYGHVRTKDALQYLIDHHREDGEVDVEVEADIEPDGGAVATEAGPVDPAGDPGPDGEDADDANAEDADAEGDPDDADADADADGEDADDADGSADDGDADDGDAGGVAGAAAALSGTGGDDGMVSEMMNLLSDHDDVWTEHGGSEGKYEVELPDGGVERVHTKDDVRSLLFKHYR